jgi:polysaccharide export outer membrane protein
VGEKDLPKEYQVASDGTIDFPYLHTVQVVGLEPQQIARRLREGLIQAQVLNDPSVIVQVKEYRSKRVTVLGQVQRPGSFPFQVGLTLVQAISQAGGLNTIAVTDRIRLTRPGKDARSVTVQVNFLAISSGEAEDILLQAGDRIFVDERVF